VFARGFKTWCETAALLQRKAIGLSPTEPLNPHRLAKHLGIDVVGAEEVPGVDGETLQVLLKEDPDSWSAITVSVGSRDLIILNSSHSGGRPASDLTHELAHILIGHVPARVDVTEDGLLILNTYDKTQEEEANWLAGCLLLPREALLHIRRRRLNDGTASSEYGVSLAMLRFRFNVSGVDFQLKRARGDHGRT
jgi:hypothetical protein